MRGDNRIMPMEICGFNNMEKMAEIARYLSKTVSNSR